MTKTSADLPVLVAGGGIGGLAAALALVRRGFSVQVFEQAPEIGEDLHPLIVSARSQSLIFRDLDV